MSDNLVLRSLKAITKESSIVAVILGRSTPNPWVGSQIELSGRDASGLLNLIGVGKTLSSQGIAPEEAPPALLQVEPAGSLGNEEVVNARVLFQPGAGLEARMTGEVIGDDEDVSRRIVGFNVGQRGNVALGVARSSTPGQLLAIAYAQCSIDPGLLRPAAVIKRCFDAMPSGRLAQGASLRS